MFQKEVVCMCVGGGGGGSIVLGSLNLYFMNEKSDKSVKVEQLIEMLLSRDKEKSLKVKDPFKLWY